MSGGEGGIRTRGGMLSHTRFPGVRLKPLIHLSRRGRILAEPVSLNKHRTVYFEKHLHANHRIKLAKNMTEKGQKKPTKGIRFPEITLGVMERVA